MSELLTMPVDELTYREKEKYRFLRTNLEFSGIENRVIVVSSCQAGDGKTTVSYNLSVALSDSGKKTLYIDADMRRSQFAERKMLKSDLKGLSHYLSGQEPWKKVVYNTNIENLSIMPTGVFPSNPAELLANARLKQCLNEMKEVFDYIIIDTPPIGLVVDAAVIAKVSDASFIVIAAEAHSRNEVKKTVDQIKKANPNFLGVVLNKVKHKEGSYYYNGYYQSYY